MSCSPTRCLIRGSIVLSMAILWPTRLFVFICARWVKRCNKPKTILFILGLIPGLSMEHKFAPQTNKDRFLGINCQGRPQPHPHPETEPQKISFFCYNLCSWKTFFFYHFMVIISLCGFQLYVVNLAKATWTLRLLFVSMWVISGSWHVHPSSHRLLKSARGIWHLYHQLQFSAYCSGL